MRIGREGEKIEAHAVEETIYMSNNGTEKSPNDLSRLFEKILEELEVFKLSTLIPGSQVRTWDLSRQSDRQIISEMLVAGMKGTGGWYLDLGTWDPGWNHRIGSPEQTDQTDRTEPIREDQTDQS